MTVSDSHVDRAGQRTAQDRAAPAPAPRRGASTTG